MKKISVVTATRAEYGLLRGIIEELLNEDELQPSLVVTGTHLSHDYGYTVTEIEKDGYPIAARIPIMKDGDQRKDTDGSAGGGQDKITDIMAAAMQRFGDYYRRERPDIVLLLGDRYELIPIAMAAVAENVPIAHLNGGEITEGAIDDAVRHCITKLSYLHFTACEAYRKRVIQLGEDPGRVFCYGDTGVENVEKTRLVPREELAAQLGISFLRPCASVTFHPVTREQNTAGAQVTELLEALAELKGMDFIVTMANADEGGREINARLKAYADRYPHIRLFSSLGVRNYISLLHYAQMIIGNSSSGIIEAPSIGIPTVDIGDRQRGRLCAESVLHCEPVKEEILAAVKRAGSEEMLRLAAKKENPYSGGDTSRRIVETIREYLLEDKIELMKPFYDVAF